MASFIKGMLNMLTDQSTPWTPADEKAFQELQRRREGWMGAKRDKFRVTLATALGQSSVKDSTVDALIRRAGPIRDALAPFDDEQS